MNIDIQKRYTLRPGVGFTKFDENCGVITDLIAIKHYPINRIAYEVLKYMNGQLTLREVIRKIELSADNIDEKLETQIFNDVIAFMNDLASKDLILEKDLKILSDDYYGKDRKPGLMYWEVTNACNYRCLMCYNSSGCSRKNELTLDEGFEALKRMRKAGTEVVIFTGGEPLLRKKEVIQWVEMAKSLDMHTEVFSNGSLITKETAKALKDAGLDYMRISMQGATEKTVNQVANVKDAYKKSLSGLNNATEAGIKVCWSTTVNKLIFPELRMIVEKAIECGCQGARFGSLDIIGKGETSESLNVRLDPYEERSLWQFIEEAIIVYSKKLKIGFGADVSMDKAWEYYVTNPVVPPPGATKDPNWYMRYVKNSLCGTGNRSAGINSVGDIIPCPALEELKMGNILTDDFRKVWEEGEFFQPFRKLLLEEYEECGFCGARYYCVGGCRANAFHQLGSLIGKDLRRCDANLIFETNSEECIKRAKSFFTREEIKEALGKIELNFGDKEKEKWFYGSSTEGHGPWIPYTAVIFRKKEEAPHLFVNA